MSPCQTSSATSLPPTWVSPTWEQHTPATCLPQEYQNNRNVFTDPVNGQRWYSDTPQSDQSQAPRVLASGPYAGPTSRLNQNTQHTSQQAPTPTAYFQSTSQYYPPTNLVTFAHIPVSDKYQVSSPQAPQLPPHQQYPPPVLQNPCTPLITHTEFKDEEMPLILSPRQGCMTMNHRNLMNEQMGETGCCI